MFSSLIVFAAAAVALASSSSSKMALAQCPCDTDNVDPSFMTCEDPSLTSIPDCVPNNITVLSIRTPSIPLVPESIRRLTNLRKLFVSWFDDPVISKVFLSGHPNISVFSIHHTNLDYVDNEWFQFSPGITTLYLYNNKIASLASDTFRYLPLLDTVFLSDNELTTLPPTLFQGTRLNNLYMGFNRWHCDCEFATFMQWVRDNGVTIVNGAFCLYPQELKGFDVMNLTPDIAC